MKYYEAPQKIDNDSTVKLFLAGTIDMGKDKSGWHLKVQTALSDKTNLSIINPKRADWDNTWTQSITDKNFSEQVNWEQSSIELSDIVMVNFTKDSFSPITLLELGKLLGDIGNPKMKKHQLYVICPEGFYRKGNVDIMCQRAGIKVYESLDEVIGILQKTLK